MWCELASAQNKPRSSSLVDFRIGPRSGEPVFTWCRTDAGPARCYCPFLVVQYKGFPVGESGLELQQVPNPPRYAVTGLFAGLFAPLDTPPPDVHTRMKSVPAFPFPPQMAPSSHPPFAAINNHGINDAPTPTVIASAATSDKIEVVEDDVGAKVDTAPEVVVFGEEYTATPTDPQIFSAAASICEMNSWTTLVSGFTVDP